MPNLGGLQLLPETRKSILVTAPGENRMLFIGLIVLVVSLAITGGLWMLLSTRISSFNEVTANIKTVSDQIDAQIIVVNNIATASQQITNISNLLGKHIYWSNAFGRLENLLSAQTQIDSLTGDVKTGEIGLKAFSPSYTAIAKQIASFVSEPLVKDIALGEIVTLTSGKLEYTMLLKVNNAEFFKYK